MPAESRQFSGGVNVQRHLGQIHQEELLRSRFRNLAHALLILGAMLLLLASVGWLLGGSGGVLLLLGMGSLLLLTNPRVSGSLILRMQGAVPLTPLAAPGLFRVMEVLAARATLPKRPRLYRVPVDGISAFAVGSRTDPAIGVTDGLLRTLSDRELSGVLAHEVSHIQSDEMRVLGLAAVLAQATRGMALIGQLFVFLNIPLVLMGQLTISWTAILLLMVAPGLSAVLHLALSRTREYDADLGAARLTGDPSGLASALHRIEELNRGLLDRFFPGVRRLRIPTLFRTHPDTEERIRRLLRLERRSLAPMPSGARALVARSRPWGGSVPHWGSPFGVPRPRLRRSLRRYVLQP